MNLFKCVVFSLAMGSEAKKMRFQRLFFILPIICVILAVGDAKKAKWLDNEEIKIFRKYLQFPTITLEADFEPCVEFLKEQAHDLNLSVSVFYPANKQIPVVLMTWTGSQPELPSILLNSHMDVVPVAEEYWTYPPFAAEIDDDGNIYARGTQDMKSVGMQYLAAIRALKRKGINQLKRTVHLTYTSDEEVGGRNGIGAFVNTSDFKNLNIALALDEGYPSASDDLEVFYADKAKWGIIVTAYGHSGHSSVLFEDTAAEKLNYVVNKFMEFRRNEVRRWKELKVPYSNITAINLTILKGGFKRNIVPPEMNAFIDMRLAIDVNYDELTGKINRWVKEAGENVTVEIDKSPNTPPTPIGDSNPFWVAFKNATEQLNLNVTPAVFPAITDSRYLRDVNRYSFGFSPLTNSPPKLHEHNEHVNAETYLKGIAIYEKIIEAIANVD